MKTAKVNLYSFAELSKEGQNKALQNLADINVDYDWYQFMIDDAARVGVEIGEFDIDRGTIKGEFIQLAEDVAKAIQAEQYGGELGALAANYLQQVKELRASDADEIRDDENEISNKFEADLLKIYLKDLRGQYEHLTSDDAIKDTIEANEYLFFESGKLIPVSMYPPKRRTIRERVRAAWAHMRAKFAPVHLALFAPAVAALLYAIITND